MKKKGIILGSIAVLILVVAVALNMLMPKSEAGMKNITIKIVDKMNDQVLYDDTIATSEETLGKLLLAQEELKVVGEEGQYGLFITSMMGADAHDDAFWIFESENNKTCGEAEGGFCPAADAVILADGDIFLFKLTNQFN